MTFLFSYPASFTLRSLSLTHTQFTFSCLEIQSWPNLGLSSSPVRTYFMSYGRCYLFSKVSSAPLLHISCCLVCHWHSLCSVLPLLLPCTTPVFWLLHCWLCHVLAVEPRYLPVCTPSVMCIQKLISVKDIWGVKWDMVKWCSIQDSVGTVRDVQYMFKLTENNNK